MKNKTETILTWTLLLGITLSVIFYFRVFYPEQKTRDVLSFAIKEKIHSIVKNKKHFDAWDNEIQIAVEKQDTGTIYIGKSAGRDLTFDTKDDILVTEVDWNKSKIVGKFIGKKSTEVIRGIVDGILEK